ncbi:HEAT repeat domain-containing protein, partial [Verrucomicrobiota bacterium]
MIRKILFCAVVAGVFAVFTVGLVVMMVSAGPRTVSESGPARGAVPSTRVANLLQNPATRLAEAERLGRVKDETSLHLLGHHAWKAEDGEFRRMCIWALGEIGSERAVQPLSTALDSGGTATRTAVTRALRNVGGERAALFLAQAAVRQREAEVREAAAAALLGMHGPEVDTLLARASGDKEADVRIAAVRSLMGRQSSVAHSALTLALKDEDERVRAAAAQCLGKTGAGPLAEAGATVERAIREDELIGVVNLLEKLRTVEVAPVLVRALDRLHAMRGGKGKGGDLVERAGR